MLKAMLSTQYHQKAQLNYDKYNTAVEVDKMDQYYNQYKSSLQSANISIGISIPFILTSAWIYAKPVKRPEFD